jgi:hypothetical protein
VNVPDRSLKCHSSSRAKDGVTLHPHAGVPFGKRQPCGAVLNAIRRADFEKEPIWRGKVAAEIVENATSPC